MEWEGAALPNPTKLLSDCAVVAPLQRAIIHITASLHFDGTLISEFYVGKNAILKNGT